MLLNEEKLKKCLSEMFNVERFVEDSYVICLTENGKTPFEFDFKQNVDVSKNVKRLCVNIFKKYFPNCEVLFYDCD